MEHYKKAINKILFNSESQSPLLKYDDSLVMSPITIYVLSLFPLLQSLYIFLIPFHPIQIQFCLFL